MGSRATSGKNRVFFENPAKCFIRSARAIGKEFNRKYWAIDNQQKRFERLVETHGSTKKSLSYLLIDWKHLKIVRRKISFVHEGKTSKFQRVRSSRQGKLKDNFGGFLLQIYSSYIGCLLFGLTRVSLELLPVIVLILINNI